MDAASYVLYGVPGWGSVLAEAMLAWCRQPVRHEEVDGFDREGPARARLKAVNPLAQVPALVLPDGTVMTESAAIALLLAERHPESGLAPPPGAPERPAFLRRLVWLVANVYPTFTFGDYPERWCGDTEGLRAAVEAHRKELWRSFEADPVPGAGHGPWVLGERFSALDIFVCVMTRWRPRRAWFAAECPRLAAVAAAADALPALAPVWARNFGSPGTGGSA
ncbi:glutathione S-transferase [Arenibaculum pallidiluteum]|uniref:glutathione S-transferase n=1 Tax=Arenibaculum pallidiluteum TaxID=2812559 RepID=UPI001A978330|nr:glutathione S-transferase [Arenibaculum pallidiluteum]